VSKPDVEFLDLQITDLSSEGDGIAHDEEGRVVFVPFTAPGDRVRVRVETRKRRFLRATVETLIEPGDARVDPVCPVYGSCGGCSWQHVAYEAQLRAKLGQVRAAFERIAKLSPPKCEITPSPSPYAYRSRTRVLRENDRVGYRRRRSHALCAITRCPILSEPLEEALRALQADPDAPDGEWELSVGDGAVRRSHRHGTDHDRIELPLAGDRLGISPGVFFQSNAGLHEALAEAVLGAAGKGELALDLYAGAGFFTLGLARRFERVVAVESYPEACHDCRRNLEAAGLRNALIVPGRLEGAMDAAPLASLRPEVIVLDPPRSGVEESALAWLAARGADRIVYLSCDAATLARDVAALCRRGYSLASLEAFDLFPQTPHVEVLAVLESFAV
jgi:23S rRNA (uracil1939-C5)-methyltransferase